MKDLREEPLVLSGYRIGVRRSLRDGREHLSVRIEHDEFEAVRAYFFEIATHRSVRNLEWEFEHMPWEPYSGVRRQYSQLWREVNAARSKQGLDLVPRRCVMGKRVAVKTFEDVGPPGALAVACELEEMAAAVM